MKLYTTLNLFQVQKEIFKFDSSAFKERQLSYSQ